MTISMNNSSVEVLSPAGTFAALEAAVRAGADAVYLGAKKYSARRNAENFSPDQLEAAVKYCHIRGVRVYLTLNIMLFEDELFDALELVRQAALCGIDGVIAADLGLCRIIHKTIPDLPLHASTQMTVMSPSALTPLKSAGIRRVVLARELPLDTIKEICRKAKELDMTVEVFVHGALCMSVSGQCLLSSVLGMRSGNRGLCAGPCRLPFSVKGGTGHDLSLKDLSLFEHVRELFEAGVTSLKIEGRMKRPEYVAAATAACRAAVDTGFVPENLSVLLKNVFSRSGFTDGYLTGKIGRDMFGVRTAEDAVSANSAFPFLHEIYRNERQSVPVNIDALIKSGSPSALQISDGKNTVTVEGAVPTPARSKSVSSDDVKGSLSKLGGTPYYADICNVNIDDNLYIPSSELNALRRKAVEVLNEKRAEPVKYSVCDRYYEEICAEAYTKREKPAIIARFDSAGQIPKSLAGIDGLMFPIESEPPEFLKDFSMLIADIPRGILSEGYIRSRLEKFAGHGFKYAYCGNLATVEIAKEIGFKIIGGTGLNAANSASVSELSDMGASYVTLSPELSLKDAVKLKAKIPKGIFAYGRLPLMLMRNCPAKNGSDCKLCDQNRFITDRKGINFNIKCRAGFSELFNSLPIWLSDKLNDYSGIDYLILYFTDESPDEALTVINAYLNGSAPVGEYTRGLYYRKVL